jgi:hypothetical protein
MSRANRTVLPRVNFFDGQRVTESDLDSEQIHNRSLISNSTLDFHGNGVVKDRLFESKVLLDTADPGGQEDNLSELTIDSGSYDGKAIYLDVQPGDSEFGNRLEIEAVDLEIGGRVKAKVLIVGRTYSAVNSSGELIAEVIEFDKNTTKLTEFYYKKVLCVFFNNFSGGTGATHYDTSKVSPNTLGTSGRIIFRESEPLKVFARTKTSFQTESPNVALGNFITSSPSLTLEEEISAGIGPSNNFNDLYYELDPSGILTFSKGSSQIASYGQKFLAKSNNIQKIDLLLHVIEDSSAALGEEFDFSGDIVVSLHELQTDTDCISDPNPENLLDFDPNPAPIVEVSYSQDDLEGLGVKLSGTPQVIEIDLSSTLIADPKIEPSIQIDKYYSILISRRGSNAKGTIAISKGFYKPKRKSDNGQQLNPEENFGRQTQRFVQFDPINLVYVDDPDSSLWFVVHSDTVEITDGLAYSLDGLPISLGKTTDFVGNTKVPYFLRNISLKDVAEGSLNYIALNRQDNFIDPGVHPRTGNFVHRKIEDSPSATIMTATELSEVDPENPPILLARVTDNNVRDAQVISGTFDKAGLLGRDQVVFVSPSSNVLASNLINRVFTPDIDCECNARYRIISANCSKVYSGDFDNDGKITTSDLSSLVDIVGNTLITETTQRKIQGGELDVLDFIKADLNEDGTIDGSDIEIIEDAIDGYVNFTADVSFDVLTLKLENILEEDDYPVLFDSAESATNSGLGVSVASSDDITFKTDTEEEALAIRTGDSISISIGFSDSGTYTVSGKTVGSSGTDVSVSVTEVSDGSAVSFAGSTGFDVEITSGTKTNLFADNLDLLKIPFSDQNWKIDYVGSPYQDSFVDVCDLRRFVETSFIEKEEITCVCAPDVCQQTPACSPQYRTQKVIANDLFIPNGEIYKEPGVPYHGDIEFANVLIPLPPGTIDDCQIDLYNNFIKSKDGTCKTAAGYPAMLYSDGTYVGCEDSGSNTDLTKNRIKISQCIASLYVDALVDGYAVDGYADETEESDATELISETFVDYTYPNSNGFSEWLTSEPSGGTYFTISTPAALNSPATFILETIAAGERIGQIQYPSAALIDPISDDFIIDFVMSRSIWGGASLTTGKVSFYSELIITNLDGTETTLQFGWRETASGSLELYYSGSIEDTATSIILNDFDYSIAAVDDLNDDIRFRLRRTDEAVFAMYFDDSLVDLSENISGQFVKIGTNLPFQPGAGSAELTFNLAQELNPDAGIIFATKVRDLTIRHTLDSDDAESPIAISRDSDSLINRVTATFPTQLTQKTNIVSATLEMTLAAGISTTDSFNLIPYNILNADNLGPIIDYPISDNTSLQSTFIPGTLSAGDKISVDITPMVIYFLSQTGHLPGQHKAVIIEPSSSATSALSITSDVNLSIGYEDVTTGVVFQIGASVDSATGIVTLKTKNILYDALNEASRTTLGFGIHLKKSGFKNADVKIGIKDLSRIGIGTCEDTTVFEEDDLCYFISGATGGANGTSGAAVGTLVQGPFPCNLFLP